MSKKASCRSEIVVVWGKVGSDNTGRGGGGASGGWGKNCLQNRALVSPAGKARADKRKVGKNIRWSEKVLHGECI